jgi:hypothetical protein
VSTGSRNSFASFDEVPALENAGIISKNSAFEQGKPTEWPSSVGSVIEGSIEVEIVVKNVVTNKGLMAETQ